MSEFKKQMILKVRKFIDETHEDDIKFSTLMYEIVHFYMEKTKIKKRKFKKINNNFLKNFIRKMSKLLDDKNLNMSDFIGELGHYYVKNKK